MPVLWAGPPRVSFTCRLLARVVRVLQVPCEA